MNRIAKMFKKKKWRRHNKKFRTNKLSRKPSKAELTEISYLQMSIVQIKRSWYENQLVITLKIPSKRSDLPVTNQLIWKYYMQWSLFHFIAFSLGFWRFGVLIFQLFDNLFCQWDFHCIKHTMHIHNHSQFSIIKASFSTRLFQSKSIRIEFILICIFV